MMVYHRLNSTYKKLWKVQFVSWPKRIKISEIELMNSIDRTMCKEIRQT